MPNVGNGQRLRASESLLEAQVRLQGVCNKEWPDVDHLKRHLQAKLEKSAEAKKLQDALLKDAETIKGKLTSFAALLGPVKTAATFLKDHEFAASITNWKSDLDTFKESLSSVDRIRNGKVRFESGWLGGPKDFGKHLEALTEKINARP